MKGKKYNHLKRLAIPIAVLLLCSTIFLSCGKKTPQKVHRVGILCGSARFANLSDEFKENMTALGYIEGKNITYEIYMTNFEPEQEQKYLREFVANKVDLIFGFNTEVAAEAKKATEGTNIPVVFANANLEGIELINNISRPGGNMTGVRYPSPEIAVKRLEIMHEIAPSAVRIWIPYKKGYPAVPHQLEMLRTAASSLGLTLVEFACDDLTNLQAELQQRSKSADVGFDAVVFLPEALSVSGDYVRTIQKFTEERKIPIGGSSIDTEEYGTCFSFGIKPDEVGKGAAYLADKILSGAPAGSLSVITPESYLVVNHKVIQELGLNAPAGLLNRANKIIK